MNNIISDCPLCEEHSLHVVGDKDNQIHQCINCGYVSSPKYVGTKDTNEEYQKLTGDMKKWAVEKNNRIWIPTMMTLPTAMLYPFDDENDVMKWGYAPIVNISEKDRESYPKPGGGYYDKTYDVENPIIYDTFLEAMSVINENAKKINGSEKTTL
jgi:Zn ribbon nucleic-acid-binding protein